METPVFLGMFSAYTTKEAMAKIKTKDLNLIVLHLQRQPVVLVEDSEHPTSELLVSILNEAGSK